MGEPKVTSLMMCSVCGDRAYKLRKVAGHYFGLCGKHEIKDLVNFEWLKLS